MLFLALEIICFERLDLFLYLSASGSLSVNCKALYNEH